MIIESVLMGEEIIDKYKLNAYSFWRELKTKFSTRNLLNVIFVVFVKIQYQKYIFSSITHSTIYLTYFHRWSILALSSKITKNSRFRPFKNFYTEAAKHGPAFGVIPVFRPDQPYLSILLVFSHFSTNLSHISLLITPYSA